MNVYRLLSLIKKIDVSTTILKTSEDIQLLKQQLIE